MLPRRLPPYSSYLIYSLLLILIFHQIYNARYAYLDEAHQLWFHADGSNYRMFQEQGRALTGWLINNLFGAIDSIDQLKYLRIISFTGWGVTLLVFSGLLTKWVSTVKMDHRIVPVISILACCSCSVAIYIGWASCVEVFLAVLCGLISGHLLFTALQKQSGRVSIPSWVLLVSTILGLASLFLYQTAFSAFLFPFFIHYLGTRYEKKQRVVIIGVVLYIVINILYFLLFKYSLKQAGIVASERTTISLNLPAKLGFFFSTPLAQGFSFNFLYNVRGLFSQLFYYTMLACWVLSVVLNKKVSVQKRLFHLGCTFCFLALFYLPILVAKENFASYRTMFNLNLAGSVLLINTFLDWLKNEQRKDLLVYLTCSVFVTFGYLNFNRQFISPLKAEYKVIRTFMEGVYSPAIYTVYFIRPPENLFTQLYGVIPYRDEFGIPSTFRDWTPAPLVKQVIAEISGSRAQAEKVRIIQFTSREEYDQQQINPQPGTLLIEPASLFK